MKDRPNKTFKAGARTERYVEAAIWKNTSPQGRPFFQIRFQVVYRTSGDFRTTASFTRADLYKLLECTVNALAFVAQEELRAADLPNVPSEDS